MSDYELYSILIENGYIPNKENLSILREQLELEILNEAKGKKKKKKEEVVEADKEHVNRANEAGKKILKKIGKIAIGSIIGAAGAHAITNIANHAAGNKTATDGSSITSKSVSDYKTDLKTATDEFAAKEAPAAAAKAEAKAAAEKTMKDTIEGEKYDDAYAALKQQATAAEKAAAAKEKGLETNPVAKPTARTEDAIRGENDGKLQSNDGDSARVKAIKNDAVQAEKNKDAKDIKDWEDSDPDTVYDKNFEDSGAKPGEDLRAYANKKKQELDDARAVKEEETRQAKDAAVKQADEDYEEAIKDVKENKENAETNLKRAKINKYTDIGITAAGAVGGGVAGAVLSKDKILKYAASDPKLRKPKNEKDTITYKVKGKTYRLKAKETRNGTYRWVHAD